MRKFDDLKKKVLADGARCSRVEAYKAELLAELPPAEVRDARQMTQEEIACERVLPDTAERCQTPESDRNS